MMEWFTDTHKKTDFVEVYPPSGFKGVNGHVGELLMELGHAVGTAGIP